MNPFPCQSRSRGGRIAKIIIIIMVISKCYFFVEYMVLSQTKNNGNINIGKPTY